MAQDSPVVMLTALGRRSVAIAIRWTNVINQETQMMPKQVRRAAIAMSLCISLAACNSKELSRAKAASILSARYPRPLSSAIVLQADMTTHGKTQFEIQFKRLLELEEADGLLVTKSSVTPGFSFPTINAVLTQKGKAFAGSDTDFRYAKVKMCEEHFNEVTGISTSEQHAVVEYTIIDKNFTPFAQRNREVYGALPKPCVETPQKVQVVMQLYDDGWRLAQ